jgi:hypothetical protein
VLSFLTKATLYSCFFIILLHNVDTNAEDVKIRSDERSVSPVYFNALTRPLFPNQDSAEHCLGFCKKSLNRYINILKYREELQITP